MIHAIPLLFALTPLLGVNDSSSPPTSTWTSLDRQIEALAATTVPAQDNGVRVGALLRSSYDSSSDVVYQTGGLDLGGFRVEDAIVWVESTVGDFDVRISADAADATAFPPIGGSGIMPLTVRDAYGLWNMSEAFKIYMGQFKCPVLASSLMGEGSLLFIDRTRLGQLFDAWQPGAAATFDAGPLHAKVAVQNGADQAADELGVVGRVELRVGEGANQREGALGAADGLNATLGAAYFGDGSQVGGQDFGSAVAVDGYATLSRISLQGEVASFDEELAGNALGNATADATPYAFTLGFVVVPDRWEVAARYQDLDDDLEETLVGGGLNYYVSGHAAKWQFNVSQYENSADDGVIVQLGLSVGELH